MLLCKCDLAVEVLLAALKNNFRKCIIKQVIVVIADPKPGDRIAFIKSNSTTDANEPLRKYVPDSSKVLVTEAIDNAPPKKKIEKGVAINVYGMYKNYYFVNLDDMRGWIKK